MHRKEQAWTLEEKIGQLFCIGFDGTAMNEDVHYLLQEKQIGNVILFSRNITSLTQVERLTESLKEKADQRLPLFVAIDQENGIVNRMPQEAAGFPGARALGFIDDLSFTEKVSEATAATLQQAGVDMNLAPVLDVNSNRHNPVIGLRAFGEDAETVTRHGLAFIKGHESQGVVSCVKHFPGHGDTGEDSHLSLPRVDKTYDELLQTDVAPFREAMEAGVPAVLISHVVYPALGAGPATLSYQVITEFLRQTLSYDGVVVTDCLEMEAVSREGTPQAAVEAFQAGADLLVISHTYTKQKEAVELLLEKVRQGEVTEARIDESFRRIRRMKEAYADKKSEEGPDGEYVMKEGTRRSLYMNLPNDLLPPKEERNDHVHVCRLLNANRSMAEDRDEKEIILSVPGVTVTESENAEGMAGEADVCILVTDAEIDNAQVHQCRKEVQERGKPLLILATRNPYILDDLPETIGAAATFDPSPERVREAFTKVIQTIYER